MSDGSFFGLCHDRGVTGPSQNGGFIALRHDRDLKNFSYDGGFNDLSHDGGCFGVAQRSHFDGLTQDDDFNSFAQAGGPSSLAHDGGFHGLGHNGGFSSVAQLSGLNEFSHNGSFDGRCQDFRATKRRKLTEYKSSIPSEGYCPDLQSLGQSINLQQQSSQNITQALNAVESGGPPPITAAEICYGMVSAKS
jgi:hypothetical protein